MQKLIVMQIMQIVTYLQCSSLSRYLFYLQFKAFPKRNDISTRKSQKCAFSCTAAIFSHTTVSACDGNQIISSGKKSLSRSPQSVGGGGYFSKALYLWNMSAPQCFQSHARFHQTHISSLAVKPRKKRNILSWLRFVWGNHASCNSINLGNKKNQ